MTIAASWLGLQQTAKSAAKHAKRIVPTADRVDADLRAFLALPEPQTAAELTDRQQALAAMIGGWRR